VPSAAGKPTYSTRGKVRAVGEKKDSVTIAHEDIPNYMKAMTMMFEVEKASILEGSTSGRSDVHVLGPGRAALRGDDCEEVSRAADVPRQTGEHGSNQTSVRARGTHGRLPRARGSALAAGLKKEAAGLSAWSKELAPSDELRKWFGHDPSRFAEFAVRYRARATRRAEPSDARRAAERAKRGIVTLVYAAHDEEHNNAVVLAHEIERRMAAGPDGGVSALRSPWSLARRC